MLCTKTYQNQKGNKKIKTIYFTIYDDTKSVLSA